jgi:hypothetical protein
MKRKTKNKKLIKFLLRMGKPFSIKGVNPIRYLNPFKNKKLNLIKLYNTIYIFNKMCKTDFKPIPYSKKLSKVEKETNKGIVESIMYEIRILFWTYIITVAAYIFYMVMDEVEIDLLNIIVLFILLVIGFLFCWVTFKLLKKPLKHIDGMDITEQYQNSKNCKFDNSEKDNHARKIK